MVQNLALLFVLCSSILAVNAYPQFGTWNTPQQFPFQQQSGQRQFGFPQQGQQQATTTAPNTAQSPEYLACIQTCPSTSEYNPICGSDSVNYHNNGRLECAIRCGLNVVAVRSGTCNPL